MYVFKILKAYDFRQAYKQLCMQDKPCMIKVDVNRQYHNQSNV